jgi:leucyl-tRNA---protein transferase
VTNPGPCPYLPGKTERKVFTELNGPHSEELNDALGRIGFRRSQNVAYRPSCIDCKACISVRVLTDEFVPNATQRKIIKRNSDLVVSACRPWSTSEQYELLRRYLGQRHPEGGMSNIEYRTPGQFGRPGELVGACLTDQQGDGLSMIYSFYDSEATGRPGLGNYIIMDHIIRARNAGLPYVYLGYWVQGAARMQYKIRYRPMERLGPEGWERFEPV